jgi:hypothetical protein
MSRLTTMQDVRREVSRQVSQIRIIDSDTVQVAPGDHPMQPSVIGGGPGVGDFVGPASATPNALVIFDGATGKLGKSSLLTWDGTLLRLDDTGVDLSIRTDHGNITIWPGQDLSATDPVAKTVTIRGGQAGASGTVGGITQVMGGVGVDADGGPLLLDGGTVLGTGSKANVVLQGVVNILPSGVIAGVPTFDSGSITTNTLGDSGAGELTMTTDINMAGFDILGYAPKESHVDLVALATEYAFS